MPKFFISKSIEIKKTTAEVYDVIRDFKTWPTWSPWFVADPDCELSLETDQYSWNGKIAGQGLMKVIDENVPTKINYNLQFIKPWKSMAAVNFTLKEIEDGITKVTWNLDSSLPFFLFWMKNMMVNLIRMDYQRELLMLKDYIETGSVPSNINLKGNSIFEGCDFIGLRSRCNIDELENSMGDDFQKVGEMVCNKIETTGDPLAVYHVWDLKKNEVEYSIGFPINAETNTPKGLIRDRIPKVDTYLIEHVGPYRHVANAWSAGIMRGRAKVFRPTKKIHPFEVYKELPKEEGGVATTLIYLPTK